MDQTESYNAEGKFTGLRILPENLTIVGIDCPDEDRPELADPHRVNLPLDEEFLAAIAKDGIREVVGVRKFRGDDRTFVVKGRRRVRAARIANAAGGDVKIKVPCLPVASADVLRELIIENEFRANDTPLARAHKAARMRDRGDTDSDIAQTFGVSTSTVKSWWNLLEASPSVQRAVERGKITATTAAAIGRMPLAKQADALRAAIEAGGKGAAATESVRRVKASSEPAKENGHRRLKAAEIKRVADALDSQAEGSDSVHATYLRGASSVLRLVLG